MTDDRRQAPRYRTRAPVAGRNPATPFSAEIANVSRTGCQLIATSRLIPVGSTVILDLTSRIAASGQVVWSGGGALGVRLHEELPDDVVAEIAGRDWPVASGEFLAA